MNVGKITFMRNRDLVKKAWQLTQIHLKKLIWYGAIPAFFSVIFSSGYIMYQYDAFKHSQLFNEHVKSDVLGRLGMVWSWAGNHTGLTIVLAIAVILFFIGYVIIPPILRGALIQAVDRVNDFKPIAGSVEKGMRHFFPLFEFGIITGSFSITTLFTESSFILRWWGVNMFFVTLPVIIFIAMVGLIVSFLFMYSEYFIVLKEKHLIESMKESAIMVIANLRRTILVLILMLLIGVRIILNVILVLIIPMLIIGLGSYLATIISSTAAIVVIGIVGFIVLLVASYLFGLFHVFATTVWVLTFKLLSSKEEDALQELESGEKPALAMQCNSK
jgi:hypothetical protein